jgi:hypothetical protein
VVQNLVRQLAALYNKSQKIYQQSYKSVHLIHIFYKLADMLVLLITLDEVIIQNWEFNQSWAMYRRCVPSSSSRLLSSSFPLPFSTSYFFPSSHLYVL